MQVFNQTHDSIQLKYVPSFRLQIPVGETANSLQYFAYVLDCISLLMKRCIPELGTVPLTIFCDFNAPNPVCYRSLQVIVLHTKPSRWAQCAYQFAHELCHYAIPGDVPSSLRWFEESICQTASLYFLKQIGYFWHRHGVDLKTSDGAPYYLSFIQYANDDASKAEVFDLKDPTVIRHLESNCYDRSKNDHVANHLLPIFTDHPEIWKAVPLMCQIQESSLQASLDAWILLSPEEFRPGLRRIRNLF
ncbi:MAG: hypothetical protein J6Q53_04950 [Oscillospiraceae bacterium]|nr:hypothetical protein [Oscillospiraceae bacterium]